MNQESLSRILSSTSSGASAVVVFSHNYPPSLQLLNHVKKITDLESCIQLIPINAEEQGHLLNLPALNASEAPSVHLFFRGRPFCSPVSDIFQTTDRLRRLAICASEGEEFETVGTSIRVNHLASLGQWRPKTFDAGSQASHLVSLLAPIYVFMDALFDL